MAITLTVEDGTGLANANSYVSFEEADAFAVLDPHDGATWQALDEERVKQLLIMASALIDQGPDGSYMRGDPTTTTQALRIPRSGLCTADGVSVATNAVPAAVKKATYELAVILNNEDRPARTETAAVTSKTVGPMTTVYAGATRLATIPAHISAALTPMLWVSGRAVRV
jgi:hypothetical protein